MKIIFISNVPPDSHKASGYQTFCQAQSLGEITNLKLYMPNRFYKNGRNPESTIINSLGNIKNISFDFKLINFLNITQKNWIFEPLRFGISNFSFALASVINAIKEKSEIIYTRDFYTLLILSIGKKFRIIKTKVVFESHQFSFIRSILVKNIDLLIVLNKAQKVLFKNQNCEILHDCIWKKSIVKKIKGPSFHRSILYAGSCSESKGIKRLIYLAEKMPDFNFFIANNEGYDNNNIIKNLKKLNTIWLGKLNKKDLYDLIDKVEFCILPNEPSNKANIYTSPMKLFEYMCRGKALILSPISTVLEIFPKHSYINLGKSNKDLETASHLIREINPNSLSQYSLGLIKQFTWEKRSKKLYQLLRDL